MNGGSSDDDIPTAQSQDAVVGYFDYLYTICAGGTRAP